MADQQEFGLKHVVLLRKVIMEKRSGTASFGGDNWGATMSFNQGLFQTGVPRNLGKVLQEPVYNFTWKEASARRHEPEATLPMKAFSQAIASMELPVRRLDSYRKVFAKLPPVKVRYLQAFRFDLEYQKQFQTLYRLSMAKGGVELDDYFALSANFTELRRRMNIVIAAYCMGDILPVSGMHEPQAADIVMPKSTMVSRILARLWGSLER